MKMKKILLLFLVLAVAGLAYAQTKNNGMNANTANAATIDTTDVNATAIGITRHEDAMGGLDVIIDVTGSQDVGEVAVCTTPEKDNGYVIVTVASSELASGALDTAENIFNSLDTASNESAEDMLGSRHFGCIREQLANQTMSVGTKIAESTGNQSTGTAGTAQRNTATNNGSAGTTTTGTTGTGTVGTTATGTTSAGSSGGTGSSY